MSSAPRSLLKEYGMLPLALSGFATASVIILCIYYSIQIHIPEVYQNGSVLECSQPVSALINSIQAVYKYPGLLLIVLSIASIIFSYVYDRLLLVYIIFCFAIFTYPFAALFDDTNVVLSLVSINKICDGGIYYIFVLIQIPLLFVSSYILSGNIILLAKRWLRGSTKNG